MWAEGIDHCTQNLTDGRIDKHMLPLLSAVAEVGTGRPEARKLVDVGLWVDMGDHWQIPNWNDYQPHRADVEAVKAKKKLAGAEGNHKRWHTDRGIVSDDCEFCHPNRSQTDRIVRTKPDRKLIATTRHDTTMIRSTTATLHRKRLAPRWWTKLSRSSPMASRWTPSTGASNQTRAGRCTGPGSSSASTPSTAPASPHFTH